MTLRRTRDPGIAVASLANAVELAHGRLDPAAVGHARDVVERSRDRLGHGTSATVVALLGATGSGKSSLFNALVGRPVAATGVRRPTTSHTEAAVWGEGADGLLDWLGVPSRHLTADPDPDLDGLVLLDVPDHDSVALEHRAEMERIAAHTDLLVWVTDHEKYADRLLHRYLRLLPGRDPVLLVVLNKVDQLDAGELTACRTDLARLVADDGLAGASVVPVSATTGAGIDDLRAQLGRAVSARRAATERIAIEVRAAAEALADQVHLDHQAGPVVGRSRRNLLDGLAEAAGVESVEAAVAAGYRRDAVAHVGWPFTRWASRLRPHPLRRLHLGEGSAGRTSLPPPSAGQRTRAAASIRDVAEEASAGLPEPWPSVLRRAASPDAETLHDRLEQAVARAARAPSRTPRWWRVLGGLQALLAAAAVAGALWLVALAVVAWLQLPDPPLPRVGAAPVPTLAVVAGLVLGWALAGVGRWAAARGARRRARAVRARTRDELAEMADELILDPLDEELRQRDALVAALRAARA